jgi:hypothetical protein
MPSLGQGDLLTYVVKGLDTIDDDLQQILAAVQKQNRSGPGGSSGPLSFGSTVAASALGTAIAIPIVNTFTSALSRIQAKATGGGDTGQSILGKSLDMLGNSIGIALMPVIAVFSAGLVSLSDYIMDAVLPHLADWTADLIEGAEAVVGFIKNLADFPKKTSDFFEDAWEGLTNRNPSGEKRARADWEREHPGMQFFGPGDMGRGFSPEELERARPKGNPTKEMAERMEREAAARRAGEVQAGGVPGQAQKPDDRSPIVKAMQDMILPELQYAMGGKGGSFGLAGAQRQAQMATFMSPFQQKSLEYMKQMLEKLGQGTEIAAKNLKKKDVGRAA